MSEQKKQSTQKSQPQGVDPKTGKPHKPVDIPVPKRGDVKRDLLKIAKAPAPRKDS